jgi:hypothetical protein
VVADVAEVGDEPAAGAPAQPTNSVTASALSSHREDTIAAPEGQAPLGTI